MVIVDGDVSVIPVFVVAFEDSETVLIVVVGEVVEAAGSLVDPELSGTEKISKMTKFEKKTEKGHIYLSNHQIW